MEEQATPNLFTQTIVSPQDGVATPLAVFRGVCEAAPDGVIIIDRSGLILFANAAADLMFGYRRRALEGRSVGVLLPERARQRRLQQIASLLNTGFVHHRESVTVHLDGVCHDGRSLPVSISIAPLRGLDPAAGSLIIRDERKSWETQSLLKQTLNVLEERNQQLIESNAVKDSFLGMAAHDLRNPLTTALFACELMRSDEELSEGALSLLAIVERSANSMFGLINDLLDVNAIESGAITVQPREVAVAAFLDEILENWGAMAGRKGIVLTISSETPRDEARFDPRRMKQVLENLISNAVKFSKPGTTVQLHMLLTDRECEFSVIDQGPGIPESEQVLLFRPFQRLSPRPTGGESSTGLGLAICKRIVELHDGTIRLATSSETGSCFVVTIPQG